MANLKFAWKAGTEQYSPGELLDYAVAAEQAGFDMIEASDHFHPWAEKGQACFVWTWLGAVAARTHRVMLGTGITCPIFRYHPSIVAQAAATLACLAPGRVFLGVGTGEALNEYSAVAQWTDYKDRRERLAESIELMRQLWTGEKITHRGTHYQTRQAKLYTRPDRPIPIYISALVPNSARFAGKHGDALITVGGEDETTYREICDNFAYGAAEAAKDAAKMPRMIELAVAYTDDEAAAVRSRKEYWAGTFIPALFTERIYTPQMSEQNGAVVGDDTIRQAVCISVDPEEHVRFAQHYIDLGFDELVFHSAGPDQRAFLEGYGKEVLPRLRRANGAEAVERSSAA
jgi:coenzyme F420-dependent glucose-6-phosphate dehydrogenase